MSRPRRSGPQQRGAPTRRAPRWGLACLVASHIGAAEPEYRDWLAHDWHEVEVVVFLHRSPQTREQLTRFDPRRYPLPLTSFATPPSAWHFPTAVEASTGEGPLPPAWLWMDAPSQVPLPEPATGPSAGPLPSSDGPETSPAAPPGTAQPPPPPAPGTIAREAFAAFEEGLVHASMRWRTDGLSLAPHVRRMRRSSDYEVLHHGRWFQAAANPRRALPVLLQLGPAGTDGIHRIEGTLRVSRALYVEVEAELWLHEGGSAHGAGHAVLSETRRMRTGDVHYLDHPRIGLVLRANRLGIPQALVDLVEAVEEGLQ